VSLNRIYHRHRLRIYIPTPWLWNPSLSSLPSSGLHHLPTICLHSSPIERTHDFDSTSQPQPTHTPNLVSLHLSTMTPIEKNRAECNELERLLCVLRIEPNRLSRSSMPQFHAEIERRFYIPSTTNLIYNITGRLFSTSTMLVLLLSRSGSLCPSHKTSPYLRTTPPRRTISLMLCVFEQNLEPHRPEWQKACVVHRQALCGLRCLGVKTQ
jgi:hypothetical protein